MALERKPSDLGSGLSLSKYANTNGDHPAGPVQHGTMGQAERAFSAASTFLSGVLAISASQFIGAPLKLVDPKFYDGYMAWTKESFAVLVTTMTQWWAPTVVRVTGDESMKGQLYQMDDGSLRCNFPHRLVLMANHQLYTDWLYLWWIAYCNKMHGRIYIILKEELKRIPIFGWSAQFYNFIFLSRKWETDKPRFQRHLKHLSNPRDPMWLLIFPEGTNLSAYTREKSKAWAKKAGIPDMVHQLLPRSTGLQFCLQQLEESTNWLYDCTIAYEGVPAGQYGQDIFTLRSSFFEGRPPKSVNMHWRRWRISDIPIDNDEAFAMWLRNRWTEKDYLLDHFYKHGTFPEGDPVTAMKKQAALNKFAKEQQKNGNSKAMIKPRVDSAKFITTEVKAGGWEEFMSIFGPITTAATAISSGQLDPNNIDFDALLNKVAQQQMSNFETIGTPPKMPRTPEELKNALLQASKLSGQPIKKSALDQIVGTAAKNQKELAAAASKTRALPTPSKKPTDGKELDPEVRKLIEDAHEETRRRLAKASAAAPRKPPPNVRSSIPMAPMETLLTRPISTIAMQRAGQMVQNAAATAGTKRKDVSASAQKMLAAQKTAAAQSPVNGTATGSKKVAPPATARKTGAQGTAGAQVDGAASKTARPVAVRQASAPAKTANVPKKKVLGS